MSVAYLGSSFDIHGVMDLVFPHHENEIAQSCFACKQSSISYRIHNGFVTVDSEKMLKSLGNFFTIGQALYDCEEILGQNSESNLENSAPKDTLDCLAKFRLVFESSMSDDLHTPVALAAF